MKNITSKTRSIAGKIAGISAAFTAMLRYANALLDIPISPKHCDVEHLVGFLPLASLSCFSGTYHIKLSI